MLHKNIAAADIHIAYAWTYANTAARTGATGFVAGDVGKLAWQQDDDTFWILKTTTPTWVQVGSAAASGGIPAYGTDPTLSANIWWFRTDTFQLRTSLLNGAYTAEANLGTVRRLNACAGTRTAMLAYGGLDASANLTPTEKYNGTAWSSAGNIPTARHDLSAAGTSTDALAINGWTTAVTTAVDKYNGTSWSTINSTNATVRAGRSCGSSSTDVLRWGGWDNVSTFNNTTETWNGTAWTLKTLTLKTGIAAMSGCGTTTAAVAFGGVVGSSTVYESPVMNFTGPTWGVCGLLPSADGYALVTGTQTNATHVGGSAGLSSSTLKWNGMTYIMQAATPIGISSVCTSGSTTATCWAGAGTATQASYSFSDTAGTQTAVQMG